MWQLRFELYTRLPSPCVSWSGKKPSIFVPASQKTTIKQLIEHPQRLGPQVSLNPYGLTTRTLHEGLKECVKPTVALERQCSLSSSSFTYESVLALCNVKI